MSRRVLLPLLGVLATGSGLGPVATASQVKDPQGIITARICVMLDLGKPSAPVISAPASIRFPEGGVSIRS